MTMLFDSSKAQTTNSNAIAEISVGARYLVKDPSMDGAIIQVESFSPDMGWYNYFFVFRPDNMAIPYGGLHFFPNSDFHSNLEKVNYKLLPGDKVCYYGPKNSYGLGDIFPQKGTEGTIISVEDVSELKDSYIQVQWPKGTVQPNKNGESISHIWSSNLLKKIQ